MSKKTEDRNEQVQNMKAFVSSCVHNLYINDAAVRVLLGFIDLSNVPDGSRLPRWFGDPHNFGNVEIVSTASQSSLASLIHKDVRSVRNAIRALEKAKYIVRSPHRAGERQVTRINGAKIVEDSFDASQIFGDRQPIRIDMADRQAGTDL